MTKCLSLCHRSAESFLIDVARGLEELRAQDTAAGSAADGVVGEADELPVKEGVGAESADGDAETALVVDVQLDLGTVVLFQVLDEVPGGAGEAELLGAPRKARSFSISSSFSAFFLKLTKAVAVWP